MDGSIDIVRGADYVTVSWNHFHATDKTMLISHSDSNAAEDTGHPQVSIHHNSSRCIHLKRFGGLLPCTPGTQVLLMRTPSVRAAATTW